MKRNILMVITGLFVSLWQSAALAAPGTLNFTISGSYPSDVTMGDLAGTALTYTITNTSSGTTARINQLTFTAPTGFTWQGASLPTGWKVQSNSNNVIQIQTTNNAYNISPGSSVTVTLTLGAIPSLSADNLTGYLTSVQAKFDKKAGASNTKILNNPSGTLPKVHSLLIKLAPSTTAVPAGGTFTLTMTVTNKSTSTVCTIKSSPQPPQPHYSGTASVSTTSNPNISSLSAGATNNTTLVWTYTASGSGTVYFTAFAVGGTNCPSGSSGNATSITAQSVVVNINLLSASIAISPPCFTSGNTATFTMTVTNNTGASASGITGTLNPYTTGSAVVSAQSAPSNACPVTLPSTPPNNVCTITWTATVTDSNIPTSCSWSTFYAQGTASSTTPSNTSPLTTSSSVAVHGFAADAEASQGVAGASTTNASSTNAELWWRVANCGCTGAAIQSATFPFPAGWGPATDSYALINNTDDTSWTGTGTSPVVFGGATTISVGSWVDFAIVFSATPTATGSSVFNVTLTNQSGVSQTPQLTTVTVNPYNNSTPGSGNYSTQKFWRETFQ